MVSLEQAVVVPFATRQLADLAARVIKVERPEGDFARRNHDTGREHSSHGLYPAADGPVLIGLQNDREWVRFCADVPEDAGLISSRLAVRSLAAVEGLLDRAPIEERQ